MILGIIKQKGGVGASTLARTIAVNFALADWSVKIADMDTKQGTSTKWNARRLQNGLQPSLSVEQFDQVAKATRLADNYDLLVFDGAPHSSKQTLDIAKASNLSIIPTGTSVDDLEPTLLLAYDLHQAGIPKDKIVVVFCRVGNSKAELQESIDYIKKTGFDVLDGALYEKTAIRRAGDLGLAATETKYKTVNSKIDILIQSIADRLTESQKGN